MLFLTFVQMLHICFEIWPVEKHFFIPLLCNQCRSNFEYYFGSTFLFMFLYKWNCRCLAGRPSRSPTLAKVRNWNVLVKSSYDTTTYIHKYIIVIMIMIIEAMYILCSSIFSSRVAQIEKLNCASCAFLTYLRVAVFDHEINILIIWHLHCSATETFQCQNLFKFLINYNMYNVLLQL